MTKRPVSKYDFKTFGAAIKAARTGRKESRKKVSDEMFITPRSIMYIENRGQHTSLNAFYKLVTLFGISVDEFFYPDRHNGEDERRKHLDRMLNGMDEKELIIMEGAAEGIRKAREHQE